MDGQPYLQFVVPGIVAYQAALLGFGDATYPVLGYIKWNRMYAATLSTPLSVTEVLLGHLVVLGANLVVAVTIFIGDRRAVRVLRVVVGAPRGIPVGLLTGLAFAVPTFAISATIETDNVFGILYRFVLTPVLLFSGTFFPLDQLPGARCGRSRGPPRCGTGSSCTRAPPTAVAARPDRARARRASSSPSSAVGWVLAHRAFTRRLLS